MVNEEKITIFEGKYKDRVLWNKITGLFTITGLQRNDSGIYTIDPKAGGRRAGYKVTVYESVPTPAVNKVNVSAESCTLLCSVERAEETTLLWYKDEVIVNLSSSALSLPLTVHEQDFSSSYRCVASNPAENKTLPGNASISCRGQNITEDGERHRKTNSDIIIGTLIPIVFAVLVLLVAFTIKWKCFDKKPRHTQGRYLFS
ncbi:CD48 antigen-like [Pagrus major]|uniref:CD48 antigen-like n=1 Tax=Pagrus major TaxID=143350 RepID=UPI003CC8CB51